MNKFLHPILYYRKTQLQKQVDYYAYLASQEDRDIEAAVEMMKRLKAEKEYGNVGENRSNLH